MTRSLFRIETDRVSLTWGVAREGEPTPLEGENPPPGRLLVRPRRLGARPRIERAGVPEEVAGDPALTIGPRLFEQTDYRVVARAADGRRVSIAHRDPLLAGDLETEDDGRLVLGYVNFRNQVGRSEITVLVDGRAELDVEVEVFPSKLDYASDYERIVAEVQEILTGLAVEYLRATFRLGRPSWVPQPTHVEWLALLGHVAGELERALDEIARRPARGLARGPVAVRADRVKRVDASVRAAARRGAGFGGALALGEDLRVRERLVERPARHTLDTPEHRWLARQLRTIARRLALLRREETRREPGARRTRTVEELDALETRLARMLRLEPIAAAAGQPPAGFVSMRLLGAPGYREAYRACLVLALGLRIEGGPVRLSVKDLSLLYEYWSYLALVRAVSEATGVPVPVRSLFTVTERGLRVDLARGRETAVMFPAHAGRRVTVRYNPLFAGGPVLVPQRPDVVVTLDDPSWPRLHLVLDAKYRVDASAEYAGRYHSPGPPEDAINVLHRYRDAILEIDRDAPAGERPERTVVHAAAAFPYREPTPGSFRESRLWRELDRLGVGAIPLLPGDVDYLREWVEAALARGGWTLADRAIAHRSRERAREWREAAAEPVLVGVLRGADPEGHLAWLREQRIYHAPYTPSQPLQLAARWVAVYSPATRSRPGAVAYAARVESVEVRERREVATPWRSRRRADAPYVVYRLGEVIALERPVENRDGRRPSVTRWTSRLALERARTLEELALETEPEWRLHEELGARGVPFHLEVASPPRGPDDERGRALFVIASGATIRYAGPAGFLVRSSSGHERYVSRAEEVASSLADV